MAIRKFKPYTPGTRQRVVTDFSEITSAKPERSLIVSKHRVKGRNNRGVYHLSSSWRWSQKAI